MVNINISRLMEGLYKSLVVEDRWKLFLSGLQTTLIISLLACLIGVAIGILVAIVKYYAARKNADGKNAAFLKAANFACNMYTTVIRGTPVIIQLLILYTLFFKGGVEACIVGFGINSGAYVCEIIRSGLMSVDPGQSEAGRSLGLSGGATMRLIIFPQAIKNILPALFNEFIALVKETSVAGYIAVRELTKIADGIKGRTYRSEPLFIAALVYLLLVVGLTQVQQAMERRLARSDRS